jgi:hypothetical protein
LSRRLAMRHTNLHEVMVHRVQAKSQTRFSNFFEKLASGVHTACNAGGPKGAVDQFKLSGARSGKQADNEERGHRGHGHVNENWSAVGMRCLRR